MKITGRRRATEGARPAWRPIPAWFWMLAAVAAVAITAFVVTTWLLAIAGHAAPGTALATARLNAVRTGLTAGAGAGAAVGLMLAFRRQHHQEIATVLTDLDATERRITELYTRAVEQLGNDKAPVRLGGLYALERLAQDNPAHRQTIVNVICAYLRMPFPATAPTSKSAPETTQDGAEPAVQPETETAWDGDVWRQERQVRLTAQRILSDHLRGGPDKDRHPADPSRKRSWPGLSIDLTGAALFDFDFDSGAVAAARFDGATFSGGARFDGVTFGGEARFDGATFSGDARFDGATFGGFAMFARVTFSGTAGFARVTFSGTAGFARVVFRGDARFEGATFSRTVWFGRVIFGVARFDGVTFGGEARFDGVTFGGAWFDGATFSGTTWFGGALPFDGVTFRGHAQFDGATFSGTALFGHATFNGGTDALSFEEARILSPDAGHIWPTGWCLSEDGSGGHTVVRANASAGPSASTAPVS